MAITKSENITLLDTDPRPLLETGAVFGNVRIFQDTAAVTDVDFDADGDSVIVAEVPSNAKIISIKLSNDDLDSGAESVVAVGLYNGERKFTDSGTTYNADGLISETSYATGVSVQTAASDVEVAFNNRNINAVNNYVWEDAGLAEDPVVNLRIGLTQEFAGTVASPLTGDVTVQVLYVVD